MKLTNIITKRILNSSLTTVLNLPSINNTDKFSEEIKEGIQVTVLLRMTLPQLHRKIKTEEKATLLITAKIRLLKLQK